MTTTIKESKQQKACNPEITSGKAEQKAEKLIVFTEGGKGGVGKTTFATLLLDYYQTRRLEPYVLDFDTESKENAGLSFFWPIASKANIDTRDGLDALLNGVQGESPVVFADLGARSGAATFRWFDDMADAVRDFGVAFAAVGIVTDDPGSVSSVIAWGKFLRERVRHIVVLNKMSDPHAQFSYWHETSHAKAYRESSQPAVLTLESINPDLQNSLRVHGETIGRVADKKAVPPDLQALKWLIRAQAIRRNINAQFDQQLDTLLP